MNNTFNIQRFGLLLKRQWLEFGKIYLISLVVVLGIFLTFYGYTTYQVSYYDHVSSDYQGSFLNFREPLFIVLGILFLTVIASSYFAHMGQKPKAIIDLMIPASTFEKFLTSIFFTTILTIASFMLLFYLTDLAFVTSLKSKIPTERYFFEKNNPNSFLPIYLIPFFTSSVFLLGSIYFNKFHYIKTAISVMIFSGIWTAIIAKSGKLLFDGRTMVRENDMSKFDLSRNEGEILGLLLLTVLTLIFWSITYVRLKEKEV